MHRQLASTTSPQQPLRKYSKHGQIFVGS